MVRSPASSTTTVRGNMPASSLRLLPHGHGHQGYVGYDHPLQAEIRGIMESLTGSILGHDNCGVDGCSIRPMRAR